MNPFNLSDTNQIIAVATRGRFPGRRATFQVSAVEGSPIPQRQPAVVIRSLLPSQTLGASLLSLVLGLLLSPSLAGALTNSATLNLHPKSIQVLPASAFDPDEFLYSMEFSSDVLPDGSFESTNDELYLVEGADHYATAVQLSRDDLGIVEYGSLEVVIPDSEDSDGNLIRDFFEVSHGINASNSGILVINGETNALAVEWHREAGESSGSVKLTTNPGSPQLPRLEFLHEFRIYQFQGTLEYVLRKNDDNTINCNFTLDRVGPDQPTDLWSARVLGYLELANRGPDQLDRIGGQFLEFVEKSVRFHWILGSEEATDYGGQIYYLNRLGAGHGYAGLCYVIRTEDDPLFGYQFWAMAITDSNDSDGDGVPDLSDNEFAGLPPPPPLKVELSNGKVRLTIRGILGAQLQKKTRCDLLGGQWMPVEGLVLEPGRTAVITLGDADGCTFYRLALPSE
ncbi:MAG TPA: hypothetical protein DCE44_04225 [Verrucomicrobiales bacterium]|nr:hypothetical protein [Verrucomicrobiales bacterium]